MTIYRRDGCSYTSVYSPHSYIPMQYRDTETQRKALAQKIGL